jgi:hypothetical protein
MDGGLISAVLSFVCRYFVGADIIRLLMANGLKKITH